MAKQSSTDSAKKQIDQNAGGKKNTTSMIGNDPLAWMKEQNDGSARAETASVGSDNEGSDSGIDERSEADQKEIQGSVAQVSTDSSSQPSDSGSVTTLVLESGLVVAVASQLYEELKQLLEQKSAVDIDASRVEMVDACGLQLLLGFVRSAKQQDIPVRWEQPSPSFLQAAELSDVKAHLGL